MPTRGAQVQPGYSRAVHVTSRVPPVGLNVFRVEPQVSSFTAYIAPMTDTTDLAGLRTRLQEEWVIWRHGDTVVGLPQRDGAGGFDGTPTEICCADHLSFLAYLINQGLERNVPYYTSFRRRPFTFLGQQREFVAEIANCMHNLPPLLRQFTIRPRYALEARVLEPVDGEPFVGLAATLDTGWAINAPLTELAAAGIQLAGFDVVRRNAAPGGRRLVGRIDRLSGDKVVLAESLDGATTIPVADVALEGSRACFAACLRTILGSRYERFERERQRLEADLLGGPGWDRMLSEMETFLRSASPMRLGVGLECAVGPRILVGDHDRYQSLIRAREVDYCFDPARTKRNAWAWRGVERFGPFSRDTFAARSPRILVMFPDSAQGVVETFLHACGTECLISAATPRGSPAPSDW